MNRFTVGVASFALSAVFTWIAASLTQGMIQAYALATEDGYIMLTRHPVNDAGIQRFACFVALILLVNGIVFCFLGLRGRKKFAAPVE